MPPGDLHWVDFPASDGHEQAGRRSAIVLQDDGYATGVSTTFVIPVTAQPANLRFPATVAIEPNASNGLKKSSVALVFQARAIDRRRVHGQIGRLDQVILRDVYFALDRLTGRNWLPPPPPLGTQPESPV
jgi:mRNA interferase MazF